MKSGRGGRNCSVFKSRISTVNAVRGSSGVQTSRHTCCSTGVSGGFHPPSTNFTNSSASSVVTESLLPPPHGGVVCISRWQHAVPVARERGRRQREAGERLVVVLRAKLDLLPHVVRNYAVPLAAGTDRRQRLVELPSLEVWIRASDLNQFLEGGIRSSAHASLLLQY